MTRDPLSGRGRSQPGRLSSQSPRPHRASAALRKAGGTSRWGTSCWGEGSRPNDCAQHGACEYNGRKDRKSPPSARQSLLPNGEDTHTSQEHTDQTSLARFGRGTNTEPRVKDDRRPFPNNRKYQRLNNQIQYQNDCRRYPPFHHLITAPEWTSCAGRRMSQQSATQTDWPDYLESLTSLACEAARHLPAQQRRPPLNTHR